MSGAQGKKAHIFLKGGQGSHMRILIEDWIFGLHDYSAFSNCLVEIAVLLSTRHSCLGISSFLRGLLRELVLYFSTSKLEAKYPPSTTVLFMLILCF